MVEVELAVGEVHNAGTRVNAKVSGVSFVVPAGWVGGVPGPGRAYYLGSESYAGLGIATLLSRASADDVGSYLAGPIQLDNDLVLEPVGMPSVSGGRVTASFEASELVAVAAGVAGETGNAAVFLLAGNPIDRLALEQAAESLADSVQFSEPTAGPLLESWWRRLADSTIRQGDFSADAEGASASELRLFSSGRFELMAGEAGENSEPYGGDWSLDAPSTDAVLLLDFDDGSTGALALGFEENVLYLNGVPAEWAPMSL